MAKKRPLKAPFPYFGGKTPVAAEVWRRLGCVDNYIEPFCGSAAMLLLRPHPPRIETINDLDPYVANFWRATEHDPDAVAAHADWPVSEVDLHARHRWLVFSDDAAEFRRRMRREPDYYDAKIAGWWCWGLCCWIGGGWCSTPAEGDSLAARIPAEHGKGVTVSDGRRPQIGGGPGQYGQGVHAKRPSAKIPALGGRSKRDRGNGVCIVNGDMLSEQLPRMTGQYGFGGVGVHEDDAGGRPQLADAHARGRGVHSNDSAETCSLRRAWLLDWFRRLRDRFRTVRVCCGAWFRVCDSESVTTRLGLTAVFFDPPYGLKADRDMKLYAQDSGTVAADVRAYCLERGGNPQMRIALAGYAGEGHELLEQHGWTVFAWMAAGGYGNRSKKGKANAKKERLWFSPHCLQPAAGLFD